MTSSSSPLSLLLFFNMMYEPSYGSVDQERERANTALIVFKLLSTNRIYTCFYGINMRGKATFAVRY